MTAPISAVLRLKDIVLDHLRRVRGQLAGAAACLVGVIAMELLAPWPLKIIFDHVLLDKPLPANMSFLNFLLAQGHMASLGVLAGAVVLIALASGVFSYGQLYITSKVGHQLTYHLRRELFARLAQCSLAFHNRSRSGELLMKVSSDTAALRELFTDWVLTVASHSLLVIGILAVMFFLNWQLSLLVALTLPALAAVLFFLNRRIKKTVSTQRKQEGEMANRLNDLLSSIAIVQAFGRQSYEEQRFNEESAQNLEEAVRTARTTAAVARSIALVAAIGLALTLLVGAWQVLQGHMTPGDLLIFVAYVKTLFKPVRNLGKTSAKFSRAVVSANRIGEILAIEPEIHDRPDAIPAGRLKGEIAFNDVSFGYTGDQLVLDKASFSIAAGERIALIGPSGVGKSTIVNLILRLYEAQAGTVRIDGVDVSRYQRESLRREIGLVLQDTVLFGASIRENIAYGAPDATTEEIEQAAREAHAHEFIEALAEGYETIIGERGATLSGGQRQRICLARALVKQPSILILDEPLTAVDAESAALINEAVARTQKGKTTLVIAHQFSSLNDFDRVFVLKDGQIRACESSDANLTLFRRFGAAALKRN
jgi:ATP-binding cassette, subfamily B, bacterial